MTPFHGWSVAVRETDGSLIKSSMTAGNSVRFIPNKVEVLLPVSCAQAHSQAIIQGILACYLVCVACNQPQSLSCSQVARGRGLYCPI